jgi:2-hydroxychromene-2-carboxylate isomerase
VQRGIFGAPTFIVKHPEGDVLLWGQDRLELVDKVLRGWRPKNA